MKSELLPDVSHIPLRKGSIEVEVGKTFGFIETPSGRRLVLASDSELIDVHDDLIRLAYTLFSKEPHCVMTGIGGGPAIEITAMQISEQRLADLRASASK